MKSPKRYNLVLTFCLFSSFVFAQSQVKNFVREHSVQINSIEPDSTHFEDLAPIGKAIGDARVVMLGEQDHGDAATFLAKTRLIKYLHEKKGFNVLAFESDFFATNYNWPQVKKGGRTVEYFSKENITVLWAGCFTMQHLFGYYLPQTLKSGNPMELTGFDSQMSTRFLLPKLDSLLQVLKIPIVERPAYRQEIYPLLADWYNHIKDSSTIDNILGFYKEIREQMRSKLPANNFWVQTVENLIQQTLQFRNWKQDYWKDMNTRDRQMAANLKWLLETKYPDQKIIVWAHNYHVSKYAGHYPEEFLNKAMTMGSWFTQDTALANQTYIMGFTSYEGAAGRIFSKPYKLEKPKTNSLENWISKEFDYAFVDFKKYNQLYPVTDESFNMSGSIKGNRYHSSQQAVWNKIYDGVFYIKNMYSCIR